jgi:RNA polymerase sigma factor (sigma-70 family)
MELTCKHNRTIIESFKCCKNTALDTIYKECLPSVKFMIISNSGSEEDANDVFHDALMILLQNSDKEGFELQCSVKTYIYSICLHLWKQELRKRSRITFLPDYLEPTDDADPDRKTFDEKIYEVYTKNFKSLTLEYQKVLNMYLLKYPMKKITEEMGYASENYAKVKKYLCKEHLKKAIFSDPVYKEICYMNSN